VDVAGLFRFWHAACVIVKDIRRFVLEQGEEIAGYLLPASGFVWFVRGSAHCRLDSQFHAVDRFLLVHGGKGMRLDLWAKEPVECYLILYKAVLPTGVLQEVQQQDSSYMFVPSDPIRLMDLLDSMYHNWQLETDRGRLRAKAALLSWADEVLHQLDQHYADAPKPDLVDQALHYLHTYYATPITLDSLAGKLECSEGHLSRVFRSKMQTSPIHYLGHFRANRVVHLLLHTTASLQDIAERTGYPDAHSLSRSFKKYMGISPDHFRKAQGEEADQHLPSAVQEYAIQEQRASLYTVIDKDYQYQVGRELYMKKRTKMMAAAIMIGLTMLIQACSSAAVNTTAEQAGETAQPEQQAQTRIVSTIMGDVEVPANPQRVAADQYMGHLLKLGIKPIGVRSFMLTEAWIEKAGIAPEMLEGIEDLGNFPMNLEKLTVLDPDLIIGSIDKNIEDYKKIGTTVFLPYWEGLSTADPLEKFRRVSKVFGKEAEAEKWIAEYLQKVEQGKAKIAGAVKEGETVSVVQIANKALYVLAAENGNYGSSTIYQMLGLPPTEKALQMEEGFGSISLEVLPDYMGDHIFVYGAGDKDADEVLSSEIWKRIPAVQKGQVYMYGSFGDKGDEFVMEDPYSLEQQLETIVNLLAK